MFLNVGYSLTSSKAMDMNGCGPIRTARIGTSPAAGPPAALATPQIFPGDHVVRVVRVLMLSSCASSSEAKTGCEGLHPVPGTENTAPVRWYIFSTSQWFKKKGGGGQPWLRCPQPLGECTQTFQGILQPQAGAPTSLTLPRSSCRASG